MAMRKLLSLLAVLALILVPLGRPVMGAQVMGAEVVSAEVVSAQIPGASADAVADMHAVMSDANAAPMPSGMPCCPEKAPVPDCAKGCPLMALCMAGSVLDFPAAMSLVVPNKFVRLTFAGNDADRVGLTHGPPPRPPKI